MAEPVRLGDVGAPSDNDACLSTVRLSDFGLRREPPRPLDDRQPGYEALFDYDTLYYDIFRSGSGREVICAGPPLLNCEEALSGLTFHLPESDRPVTKDYRPPRTHLQPTHRVHLSGEGLVEAERIVLRLGDAAIEVPIRPSGRGRFAGRRVVTTLSKDNPLDWISDWAEFNVRVHGADAVILYDNGSTADTLDDISARLGAVEGLSDSLVVPWLFPYGPVVGPRNAQDSFYCHPGQLDHIRRRYCEDARAVLNTDIDELVVGESGDSVFERVERTGKAALVFAGTWVEVADEGPEASGRPVRHADFVYRHRHITRQLRSGLVATLHRLGFDRGGSSRRPSRWDSFGGKILRSKWVAVPGRCGADAHWGVHDVYSVAGDRHVEPSNRERPTDIVYRHLRQLTLRENSDRHKRRRYSPLRFVRDRPLLAAFAVAFPARHRRADGVPGRRRT